MARAAVAIGAVLLVGGGGVLGYALTRKAEAAMTPEASAAMASASAQLDGDLKAARAQVEGRAKTLADVAIVRTAVATDATTAKDMVTAGTELAFKVEPGEVIELGQQLGDAPATPLLVLPEGGIAMARNKPAGAYAALVDNKLVITHKVDVTPNYAADTPKDLKGYVTVSRPLDLTPSLARMQQAGITGKLELGGATAMIGTPVAGAKTETRALSEPGAQLVVDVPAKGSGAPTVLIAAGGGAAGLGLLLLVVGLVSRRPAATAPPPAVALPTTQPTVPPTGPSMAQTKLSAQHSVATGTPSPVDSIASSAINPSNLGPGAMIGRWEVVRRLGSGGMADVYLAHSKGEAGFEKLVAIKVMHPHLARNERAVAHFLDEARLAARISHPNVVAIQDLGRIGNDYVIVMDYVEGVDLERLLASARGAGRPVPVDVGLGILCRICDGLNAAHTAIAPDGTPLNIIHRDVKSANVLVSRQGGVKVVDFGIAKAATQVHMTIAGETKGTPSMMAPEQRVGEQVDVRADVYSVAAVAYEVLTGHAVNLDLAALAHLGVENWPHLPLPTSLRPNLPPELDELLLTAMAFDRTRRPENCAVFEAQLEAIMKRHGMGPTDKDIARWVDSELRLLVPAFQGATSSISKPAGA